MMTSEHSLNIFAEIVGWGYFLCWIFSFFPQIYENWSRKSAVGLSFDMLAFYMTGYVTYMVYNLVIFFDREIQEELLQGSTDQGSPVKLSDVFFAVLAFICTGVQILQCFLYERGDQDVDKMSRIVIVSVAVGLLTMSIICGAKVFPWLWVLQYCGYVKMGLSVITYSPQVWLNYKRKCTEGFAIGGVLLDFSGGVLSILQQDIYCVIEQSNKQLTGNIPKLALGGVTLFFNIILVWQHYVFYVGNVPPELQKKTILLLEGDENSGSFELQINDERKPLLA